MESNSIKRFNTVSEFVNAMNKMRRENKDKWCFYSGEVAGAQVRLTFFNTSIQKYTINNLEHGGVWDMKVSEFKDMLEDNLILAVTANV
jgi:hypothetical protein